MCRVGETGIHCVSRVGETGVGEMGIGETEVGEMGVGETGPNRPNRTPINQRICLKCEKIEDEYHFVIECILYQDLRKQYISPYFWKRPSMFKFVKQIKNVCVN